jgi:hypothetical protein
VSGIRAHADLHDIHEREAGVLQLEADDLGQFLPYGLGYALCAAFIHG